MPKDPVIIEPEDHPITREMIDDDALAVMRKLNKAGFASYLVGGGVRDLYLGKNPKDFDISTDAKPGQIRRLFSNSRTIGRRFRLVQVFFRHHKVIEVSTLRSLSEHDLDGPEAVLAPNNTYGTLGEDAQRRDLSINALFYEIEHQQIIDYVDGVRDLENCVVRIIGTPDRRIQRDPVRMMRVIRHSARNNFTVDTPTWEAVCRHSNVLGLCPPSRLRDELLKDLYSGVTQPWFELSDASGIFPQLFALYSDIMATQLPNGMTCRDQLRAIFATIDRLNRAAVESGMHRQPDYFLLAFILIPWAFTTFDLSGNNFKGPQQYHLAKNIRDALNETIGPALNLRRAARQEITTLLANLPVMIRCQEQNQWPKWLKRKSYFAKCRLLQLFYREAEGGERVPDSYFQKKTEIPPERERGKNSRKRGARRKGRPAFSSSRKGGVFGFKR